MKQPRHHQGQLYIAANGSIRLKFWTTVINGSGAERKRKDVFVCQQDSTHYAEKRTNGDSSAVVFNNEVLAIRDRLMLTENDKQRAFHKTPVHRVDIHTIAGFWENVYRPWAWNELRKSTVKCYVHIWKSDLKAHFGEMTFLDYSTVMASRYLTSLAERGLKASTISHIRALASAIFGHAVKHYGLLPTNPWSEAGSSKKYQQSEGTEFYAVEEAVSIIEALSPSHPDWSALMGLCFYAGLRPSEAIAIRWEDFRFRDGMWHINISRGCVDGHVSDTKTEDSKQQVPVATQLGKLLQIWNQKSYGRKEGWVFPAKQGGIINRAEKPMDLRNLCQRHMKQAVISEGFEWWGLYAFRRGLATHLKGLGDVMGAQAMLRHKNPDTTESYYAKLTAADRLRAIRFLEAGTEALHK